MLQEAANTLLQKQTSQVIFLPGTQHALLRVVDRYPCQLRQQKKKTNHQKAHHQKPKPNETN